VCPQTKERVKGIIKPTVPEKMVFPHVKGYIMGCLHCHSVWKQHLGSDPEYRQVSSTLHNQLSTILRRGRDRKKSVANRNSLEHTRPSISYAADSRKSSLFSRKFTLTSVTESSGFDSKTDSIDSTVTRGSCASVGESRRGTQISLWDGDFSEVNSRQGSEMDFVESRRSSKSLEVAMERSLSLKNSSQALRSSENVLNALRFYAADSSETGLNMPGQRKSILVKPGESRRLEEEDDDEEDASVMMLPEVSMEKKDTKSKKSTISIRLSSEVETRKYDPENEMAYAPKWKAKP
jgi:hypothetical protein